MDYKFLFGLFCLLYWHTAFFWAVYDIAKRINKPEINSVWKIYAIFFFNLVLCPICILFAIRKEL